MKHILALAALLMAFVTNPLVPPASAQESDVDAAREAIRADKRAVVEQNMELTESEAKAFWPLYDEYQAELESLGDRMTELIESYGLTHKVMNDDLAASLLKKLIDIQGDRVKLMEKYLPKFENVLPMTKVARYYQIENKYRAALDYEITSKIPLVE